MTPSFEVIQIRNGWLLKQTHVGERFFATLPELADAMKSPEPMEEELSEEEKLLRTDPIAYLLKYPIQPRPDVGVDEKPARVTHHVATANTTAYNRAAGQYCQFCGRRS